MFGDMFWCFCCLCFLVVLLVYCCLCCLWVLIVAGLLCCFRVVWLTLFGIYLVSYNGGVCFVFWFAWFALLFGFGVLLLGI